VILGLLALRAADSSEPPTTGHVLILENGRTLQGDIQRQGSQYCIRRSLGETATGGTSIPTDHQARLGSSGVAETWIPADKVTRLCASLEEAYDYLRRQANLSDPDERMRLARWCEQHEMHDQALVEVTAAVELRPHNAEYRRLLQSLQRAAADRTTSKTAADPRSSILDPRCSGPVDLTASSVSQFITKVQPVLMNTCAGCHGPAHEGPFQLERVVDNGVVSRRATQYNLAHVLAQINPENVAISPLLTKAVAIHGEAVQPPIKNREAAAFHRLEDWIKQTLENNPQLRERPATTFAGEPGGFASSEPQAPATGTPPKKEPKKAEDTETPGSSPPSEFATSKPAAPKPTAPVDPFDPVIFNRQTHPEKQ
jgi:hypothetical protein